MTHVIASNYLPDDSIRCCGNRCSLIVRFRGLPILGLIYRVLGIKPGAKVYQLASFGTKGEISVRDLSAWLAGMPFCRGITNWTFGFHFQCSQFASRPKDISVISPYLHHHPAALHTVCRCRRPAPRVPHLSGLCRYFQRCLRLPGLRSTSSHLRQ